MRYIILENIFTFFKLEFWINKNLDEKNNFEYIIFTFFKI